MAKAVRRIQKQPEEAEEVNSRQQQTEAVNSNRKQPEAASHLEVDEREPAERVAIPRVAAAARAFRQRLAESRAGEVHVARRTAIEGVRRAKVHRDARLAEVGESMEDQRKVSQLGAGHGRAWELRGSSVELELSGARGSSGEMHAWPSSSYSSLGKAEPTKPGSSRVPSTRWTVSSGPGKGAASCSSNRRKLDAVAVNEKAARRH